MRFGRTALVTAAAAALALALTPAALAAPGDPVVVTADEPNGWVVNPDPTTSTAAGFVVGPATLGAGSLAFGPIGGTNRLDKFIVQRAEDIPLDGPVGFAFDFLLADVADARQFYFNIHVDTGSDGTGFFDCSYDYVATATAAGWQTLAVDGTTVPTDVRQRGTGPACGATLGANPGSSVVRVVINAGDTSTGDAGLAGNVDNAQVTAGATTTVYDFEPTRNACKGDGWRTATDADGNPFRNQGECVAYVSAP